MPTLQVFRSPLPRLFFHHTVDPHPRDTDFQMHVHDEYEMFYLISGQVEYWVETAMYPLKPGCLLITRPMESHRIHILDDVPYERCCINFTPQCLEQIDPAGRLLVPFHNRPLGQNCLFSPDEMERIPMSSLISAICEETADPTCTPGRMLTYLYPLLSEVRRAFNDRAASSYNVPRTTEELLVDFVNLHLYEDLSISRVCEFFYMSPSQVSRLFKRATGTSLWDYVLFKRLTEARHMIREGAFARQAAEAVGFKDYSVFYRAYLKRFGVSPKRDSEIV